MKKEIKQFYLRSGKIQIKGFYNTEQQAQKARLFLLGNKNGNITVHRIGETELVKVKVPKSTKYIEKCICKEFENSLGQIWQCNIHGNCWNGIRNEKQTN